MLDNSLLDLFFDVKNKHQKGLRKKESLAIQSREEKMKIFERKTLAKAMIFMERKSIQDAKERKKELRVIIRQNKKIKKVLQKNEQYKQKVRELKEQLEKQVVLLRQKELAHHSKITKSLAYKSNKNAYFRKYFSQPEANEKRKQRLKNYFANNPEKYQKHKEKSRQRYRDMRQQNSIEYQKVKENARINSKNVSCAICGTPITNNKSGMCRTCRKEITNAGI